MKIKTSDLTGPALDWAVAKCENAAWIEYDRRLHNDEDTGPRPSDYLSQYEFGPDWTPSTDWSQGGPIIEREEISIGKADDPNWWAFKGWKAKDGTPGPTPLIAAMRCFVASRLGDVVDVPEELT